MLSPFLTGALFFASAAMAFGNRLALAHWVLVLTVPIAVWFGSRARKIASCGPPDVAQDRAPVGRRMER